MNAKVRSLFDVNPRPDAASPERGESGTKALWQFVKESADAWDRTMTPVFDAWLKSPSVVVPAGRVLSAAARVRSVQQRSMGALWRGLGLPTRSGQERTLAEIHRLESRIAEHEITVEELRDQLRRFTDSHASIRSPQEGH
ncbi:MAG: hypothetical protein AAF411_26470 [Myxococcota bacterium]